MQKFFGESRGEVGKKWHAGTQKWCNISEMRKDRAQYPVEGL